MHDKPPKWYEEWFDRDEYEIVYRHRDDRDALTLIDLIERIANAKEGDSIVDVGCGRGRHAILLAQRGYRVTGLDLSERSIEVARLRAAEEGLAIDFEVGDMRVPLCSGCFDGAVNLFTAFGYFENESEHQTAVNAMSAALKPGGWLVQDFLNPSYVRKTFVAEDRRIEDDTEIIQRRQITKERIRKTITLHHDGGSYSFEESVRLLELDDFRKMYEAAGLRLAGVYGSYTGGEYGPDSPRMIMQAVRHGGP